MKKKYGFIIYRPSIVNRTAQPFLVRIYGCDKENEAYNFMAKEMKKTKMEHFIKRERIY
jgi:hypothetical protein